MKQNRNSFKVDKADYLLLQKAKAQEAKIGKEQMELDRKFTIENLEMQIMQAKRLLNHKNMQIKGEIPVIEVHEGYKDKLKPQFWLQNEADNIELEIKKKEEHLKNVKEELEKAK